ncbi:MAG: hypothetical protein HZA49_07870 [Planctomycetes bacterium]|nr:hypothetical protein [Planctomycetota bacterium]
MVKFSDISKLWKDPEEEPKKDSKAKKPVPVADTKDPRRDILQGQLKTPEVPQARLVKINDADEKPAPVGLRPQLGGEPRETVKYSAGSIKPKGDAIGAPREEISFRNIGASENKTAPREEAKLNIAEVAKQDDKIEQAASAFYDRLYSANQNVVHLLNSNLPARIDIRELIQLVKEIVSFMDNNGAALVGFAYREPKPDYFISHQVNLVLFSISIGSGLGYNQNQLEELGLTAFVHDVAMKELLNVVEDNEQRRSVVGNEVIRNYIKSGLQILRQIPLLPAVILEVCRQYHESYHGGSESGVVHEYAQIMMVADNFESLTHYRPNRVTRTAQAALRELIETADTDFARKALKILIKQVGIYPVGTFVLLNTQEIAEVARHNDNFPLRPVVNVLYVSEGKLSLLRTVDLLSNPSLYVTGTLTREEVADRAKPEQNS